MRALWVLGVTLLLTTVLCVAAPIALARASAAGQASGHHPSSFVAQWCSESANPSCFADDLNGTGSWTVVLTWRPPAGVHVVGYEVIANQSTGVPGFTPNPIYVANGLARNVFFSPNSSNDVVLGTNERAGWGLNPTQNWEFGICATPKSHPKACDSLSNYTLTSLHALFPGGTVATPLNVTAVWAPPLLYVNWTDGLGTLEANFFRVGALTGPVCDQPPTLAEWNATTWRHDTTRNETPPSNTSFVFGGTLTSQFNNTTLCVYVEAVNTSIGDGNTTLYPHGFPSAPVVLETGTAEPTVAGGVPGALRSLSGS